MKLCKNPDCRKEFEPILNGSGIALSNYCRECDYKRKLDRRIEQMGKRMVREEQGLKSPKIEINRMSEKQSAKNAQLAKIKKDLPSICVIRECNWAGVDLCHLLPKSLYPEYYLKKENLVRMCRRHHNLFDDVVLFRQYQTDLFKQVASFDEMAANKYFNYADDLRTSSIEK